MNDVMMAAVIFFAIFMILKSFTDFLLKRKIIKAGHFDNAGILEQKVTSVNVENQETNKYPSLKWGLVALFAGIGFIIIDQLTPSPAYEQAYNHFMWNSMLPFGIELVAISFGFLTYFAIVNFSKKN
ncbi:MAG: hypothetical protein ACM3P1_07635 [Candidatus Saccharibacteria bacterium]